MNAHGDLTRNQALVLEKLEGADGPMSAYALLDALREAGLRAPLQVYRALDKLTEMGLAHRLETLNAFVACAHPHCHASGLIAFAICETCGQVEEFSDDLVRAGLKGWSEREGFAVTRTTMEIRGACRNCAAAA